MVFGLYEYLPIHRFEASAVKAMRPILTTCILSNFVHSPVLNTEVSHTQTLLSLLHCDVHHGEAENKILKEITCTGRWFWIHSSYFSLMSIVNHFVNDYSHFIDLLSKFVYISFHLGFDNFRTWDCRCEHSPTYICTLRCDGCQSMQQSELFLIFCCCVPSLWLPFIPFSLSPLHLESTLLGLKDLFFFFRFPEAFISERQISRVFWTIRNSRFPEVRWSETT